MNKEMHMLLESLAACEQRIEKLRQSLDKNRPFFPFNAEVLKNLSDEQQESVDALILRYSQSVSMIQDQIFRGIAYVEQENLQDKSNRDKSLLMEKLGAIRSADEFGTAAVLRNKFSHHYPEDSLEQIERLNLLVKEADFVITAFEEIVDFLKRKGFILAGCD